MFIREWVFVCVQSLFYVLIKLIPFLTNENTEYRRGVVFKCNLFCIVLKKKFKVDIFEIFETVEKLKCQNMRSPSYGYETYHK